MSFRYKTILGVAVIEMIMVSLIIWSALHLLVLSNETELIKRAHTITRIFALSNKSPVLSTDLATLESFVTEVLQHSDIEYARILDRDRKILAQGGGERNLAKVFRPDSLYSDVDDGIFDTFAEITEAGIEYGRVEIGFSIANIDVVVAEAKKKGLVFAVIGLLLSAVFSFFLGMYLTRSITRLREGSQSIISGNLGSQITIKGNDELAETALVFNKMSKKLLEVDQGRTKAERELHESNLELENRVHERTIKLQESKKQFQQILNNSPLGILIAESQTLQVHYANPAICNLLGYDKESLEHMDISLLHKPADVCRIRNQFDVPLKEKQHIAVDVAFLKKDGSLIEADVISAPINFDGKACMVGFILDHTEKKTLEAQLHRAQKMEAIGMMAGGVAHDLNNILSGIVSYPELLLLQLPESSQLRKPIEAIQESGQRAATVVADLLTVARGVAITKDSYDIHALIKEYLDSPECENLRSSYPEISCTKKLNAGHSIISCSPVHIKKAVMNLIINAVEATNTKGNVLISTRNQQLDTPEARGKNMSPGYYLILSIQDDGSGISEKDLKHIFEPFYSKKVLGQSGTGLGLAIVWNAVQDHNGKIFVESSHRGTCFHLYFPINKDAEIPQLKTFTGKLTGASEHILVIDDEPQLRDIACRMLEGINYTVDSVCSGELAIKYVKNNPVDLIVIDMLMEPGMSGRQTYEEILKLYPNQKAIIASGFSESDDVKATLKLGADDFIKKPYSKEQLGQAVKNALNS